MRHQDGADISHLENCEIRSGDERVSRRVIDLSGDELMAVIL